MFDFSRYFWNILIALDQGLNALTGGDPDETLSSRWAKGARRGDRFACVMCRLLGHLDAGHCERVIELDEGSRSAVE